MYSSEYIRQDKSESNVKFPFKWMPLESLQEGMFSQKSDVVSYMHVLTQHNKRMCTIILPKDGMKDSRYCAYICTVHPVHEVLMG